VQGWPAGMRGVY